jgi:hypothetical protein
MSDLARIEAKANGKIEANADVCNAHRATDASAIQ